MEQLVKAAAKWLCWQAFDIGDMQWFPDGRMWYLLYLFFGGALWVALLAALLVVLYLLILEFRRKWRK